MNEHINNNPNSLVGYWRFNDYSGNTVNSMLNGNNCNGTINNATWNTDVPFTNGISRPEIEQNGSELISSSSTGNQWNLNGVPIQNETDMTIVPAVNGFYSVTVTDPQGCIATSLPVEITTTSVEEKDTDLLSVHFNMIENSVIVNTNLNEKLFMSVFNSSGKYILNNEEISSGRPFSLTNLPSGIYIVSISVNERPYFKKIVKYN
jgi:hypothetical protein